MTDNEIRTIRILLQNLLDNYSDELARVKAALEMLVPDAKTAIDTGQEPVNQNIAFITDDPTLGASPAPVATPPTV